MKMYDVNVQMQHLYQLKNAYKIIFWPQWPVIYDCHTKQQQNGASVKHVSSVSEWFKVHKASANELCSKWSEKNMGLEVGMFFM